MLETLLLAALLTGPIAAALPRHAPRILGTGAIAAIALAGAALTGHPTSLPGISLEGIGSLVLVLTLGMGATVMAFARRNLRHEPYQRRFTVVGSLLVTSAAIVGAAANLPVLTGAWIATSILTVALLRTGPDAGRDARSVRARRAFLIGDASLVVAVALLLTGHAPVVAGLLALVAAAARSASGPFHRWLPDSLAAPTTSSALLHAGVVNGGPILLIKLAPDLGGLLPVAIATAVVGGVTCVLAEAVMLTRPDVKGQLAWSTIAQMSFTLLLCGLGLPIAAGLHLIGHGLYKGNLFLGSGSGVRAAVRRRRTPIAGTRLLGRRAAGAISIALPVAAIAGAIGLRGVAVTPDLAVPLLLAAVAAYEASRAALVHAQRLREAAVVIGGIAVMAATYATVTAGLDHALAPQLELAAPALSALWLAPVLLALVAIAVTHHSTMPWAGAARLDAAWALARRAGRPDPAFRATRIAALTAPHRPAAGHRPHTVPPATRPSPDPLPTPDLAGASA